VETAGGGQCNTWHTAVGKSKVSKCLDGGARHAVAALLERHRSTAGDVAQPLLCPWLISLSEWQLVVSPGPISSCCHGPADRAGFCAARTISLLLWVLGNLMWQNRFYKQIKIGYCIMFLNQYRYCLFAFPIQKFAKFKAYKNIPFNLFSDSVYP